MAKSTADIICILDESGSMEYMGPELLDSMNKFIREQQEVGGESYLSLYTFSNSTRQIYSEVPLGTVKKFDDYRPNGCTALYDCISDAIDNKMTTNRNKNVILMIITDGLDNSSHISCEDIKVKIKTQEDTLNWQVLYLAANQDAFSIGESMYIKPQKCCNYKADNLTHLVRAASESVSRFRQLSQTQETPDEISLTK